MVEIQRNLWTHHNSFVCVRWLERMLALLTILCTHPLTQSHHSQFDVSSQGCQTVKLFHFLTWVLMSLFLERVGWLLRMNKIIYCHGPFLASGCSDKVCMPSLQCCFHFWVPWDAHQANSCSSQLGLAPDNPWQVETLIGTAKSAHAQWYCGWHGPVCLSQTQNALWNGMQGMTVDGVDILFSHDGVQLFVWHCLPMDQQLSTMQAPVLTWTKQWHLRYNLMHHLHSSNPWPKVIVVHHHSVSKEAIEKW